MVYMDTDSEGYMDKLAKLRRISPMLAEVIANKGNKCIFNIHCDKRG